MKKQVFFITFLLPLFLLSDKYLLSPMEKKSIQMAQKWINNNSKIQRQKDGSLAFYYGDNMPSLICKPLTATTIKLEKGEVLKSIKSGDSERWKFDKVENAVNGRTFVLVKPTKSNIMTNVILFTDKRIYNIKLISTNSTWIPSIGFIYDQDTKEETVTSTTTIDREIEVEKPKIKSQKKSNKHKLSQYSIKTSSGWNPADIYQKHGKTYIKVGKKSDKDYKLFVMNKNRSKTVRYRHRGNYLVVNTIIEKAILIKDGFMKSVIKIRKNR